MFGLPGPFHGFTWRRYPPAMTNRMPPPGFACSRAGSWPLYGRPMSPVATPPPAPRRPARLAVWMAASVALFVLVGSLALVLAFQHNLGREERRAFEAMARTNARFLEHGRLPRSDRLAAELGRIIGARVFFWNPDTATPVGAPGDSLVPAATQAACDGRVRPLPNGEWLVGLIEKNGDRILFLRPATPRMLAMDRPDTWLALGGFWLLSLALGWGLARRVTRPLQSLAASLPLVGTDDELPPLPTARRDEIGRLAQTLVRTHTSLREERERRRQAERHAMLGKMTASLAHEVRNPLTAIRLHAQLLEQAAPAEAAVSRALIESEAGRIEALVAQWLSHAKPAPPVRRETDLTDLIRQAVRLLEPQAGHARVELGFPQAAAPAIIVRADGDRLRQVLGNLLLNAIQAMPHGGRATVNLLAEGQRVAVVVEDEGPGFSPAALARAGEPFFSEKEGGMGLGLTVVRDICEAHGGTLDLGNRPAGGAWVRAELPTAPPSGPNPPPSAP